MKLHDIRDNKGAHQRRRPLGRGIGSGRGKTSSRGGKGQTARTGVSIKGFEGGQMPLTRRLPKFGFTNVHKLSFTEVTLGRLQEALDSGRLPSEGLIDGLALVKCGVVKKMRDGIKILGTGVLKSKVHLKVAGITQSAKKAVEALGGVLELESAKVHLTEKEAQDLQKRVEVLDGLPQKKRSLALPKTSVGSLGLVRADGEKGVKSPKTSSKKPVSKEEASSAKVSTEDKSTTAAATKSKTTKPRSPKTKE